MLIVDFWGPNCAPCTIFGPTFEEVSEEFPEALFGKVNTEQEPELANHFNVRSIPTVMMVREKVILFCEPGAFPKKNLKAIVKKGLSIDMEAVHGEVSRMQQVAAAQQSPQ